MRPENVSVSENTLIEPCLSLVPSIEHFVVEDNNSVPNRQSNAMVQEAWEGIKKSFVNYKGKPVGTVAAMDSTTDTLNYNQVFVRDFVPTGLACLMKETTEPEIIKNFLLKTLQF